MTKFNKQSVKKMMIRSKIKIKRKLSNKQVQESYNKARKFVSTLKKQHFKPLKYHIHNSYLVYSSIQDKHSGIAKGTSFETLVFPNLYRVDQKVNNTKITTFRAGITNKVTPADFKWLSNVVYKNHPVKNTGPSLIVLSLLGACTTSACKVATWISKTGILPSAATTSLAEDHTIHIAKITKEILPLFVPIRPQSIKIGPFNMKLSKSAPTTVRDDEHYTNMSDLIDIKDAASAFKSIVDIANYFFGIKDRYNMIISCKGSIDRSGIVDAIIHATFNCICTKKRLDYKYIRQISKDFLEPNLFLYP